MLKSAIRRKRVKELKEELIRISSIKFDFSNQHTQNQINLINSQKAQLVVIYNSIYYMIKGNLSNLDLLSKEDLVLISNRLNGIEFNYYLDERYREMVIFLMSVKSKLSQLLNKKMDTPLEVYKQKIKTLINKKIK